MLELWEVTIGTEYISIRRISTVLEQLDLDRRFELLHHMNLPRSFDLVLDVGCNDSRFLGYHLVQSADCHLRVNELLDYFILMLS